MKKVLFCFALCTLLLAGCSAKVQVPEYVSGYSDEYVRDGNLCVSYRVSVSPSLTDDELVLVFDDVTHDDDYYLHTVFFYDDASLIRGSDLYNVAMLEETSPGAKPEITRPAASEPAAPEDYYYETESGSSRLISSLPFDNIEFNENILRLQYAGVYVDQQSDGFVPYLTVFIDFSSLSEYERHLFATGEYPDSSPVLHMFASAKHGSDTVDLSLLSSGIYGDVGDCYMLCVFTSQSPLGLSPEEYTYNIVSVFWQESTYESDGKAQHFNNKYVVSLGSEGIPIDFPPYSELEPYLNQ